MSGFANKDEIYSEQKLTVVENGGFPLFVDVAEEDTSEFFHFTADEIKNESKNEIAQNDDYNEIYLSTGGNKGAVVLHHDAKRKLFFIGIDTSKYYDEKIDGDFDVYVRTKLNHSDHTKYLYAHYSQAPSYIANRLIAHYLSTIDENLLTRPLSYTYTARLYASEDGKLWLKGTVKNINVLHLEEVNKSSIELDGYCDAYGTILPGAINYLYQVTPEGMRLVSISGNGDMLRRMILGQKLSPQQHAMLPEKTAEEFFNFSADKFERESKNEAARNKDVYLSTYSGQSSSREQLELDANRKDFFVGANTSEYYEQVRDGDFTAYVNTKLKNSPQIEDLYRHYSQFPLYLVNGLIFTHIFNIDNELATYPGGFTTKSRIYVEDDGTILIKSIVTDIKIYNIQKAANTKLGTNAYCKDQANLLPGTIICLHQVTPEGIKLVSIAGKGDMLCRAILGQAFTPEQTALLPRTITQERRRRLSTFSPPISPPNLRLRQPAVPQPSRGVQPKTSNWKKLGWCVLGIFGVAACVVTAVVLWPIIPAAAAISVVAAGGSAAFASAAKLKYESYQEAEKAKAANSIPKPESSARRGKEIPVPKFDLEDDYIDPPPPDLPIPDIVPTDLEPAERMNRENQEVRDYKPVISKLAEDRGCAKSKNLKDEQESPKTPTTSQAIDPSRKIPMQAKCAAGENNTDLFNNFRLTLRA